MCWARTHAQARGLFEIAPGGPDRTAPGSSCSSPGTPGRRNPTTGHPSRDPESVLDRRPRTTHHRLHVFVQDSVRVRPEPAAAAQRQRRGWQLRLWGRGQQNQGRCHGGGRRPVVVVLRRRRLSHLRQPDVRLQADTEDAAVERGEFGAPARARQADGQLFRRAQVATVTAVADQASKQLPTSAPVLFGGRASGLQFFHHPEGRGPDDRSATTHAVARRARFHAALAARKQTRFLTTLAAGKRTLFLAACKRTCFYASAFVARRTTRH